MEILLISVQNIKDSTGLHANVDDKMIIPEVLTVQEVYLRPLIGKILYQRLCDGVKDNNLSADEKLLITKHIRNVISYYVLAELPSTLSYQFFTSGAVKLSTGNGERSSVTELDIMRRQYKTKAEQHATLLKEYLDENSNLFPLYLAGRTGAGDRGDIYSCPIYLG